MTMTGSRFPGSRVVASDHLPRELWNPQWYVWSSAIRLQLRGQPRNGLPEQAHRIPLDSPCGHYHRKPWHLTVMASTAQSSNMRKPRHGTAKSVLAQPAILARLRPSASFRSPCRRSTDALQQDPDLAGRYRRAGVPARQSRGPLHGASSRVSDAVANRPVTATMRGLLPYPSGRISGRSPRQSGPRKRFGHREFSPHEPGCGQATEKLGSRQPSFSAKH
jgi:hypothetical protein